MDEWVPGFVYEYENVFTSSEPYASLLYSFAANIIATMECIDFLSDMKKIISGKGCLKICNDWICFIYNFKI